MERGARFLSGRDFLSGPIPSRTEGRDTEKEIETEPAGSAKEKKVSERASLNKEGGIVSDFLAGKVNEVRRTNHKQKKTPPSKQITQTKKKRKGFRGKVALFFYLTQHIDLSFLHDRKGKKL